MAYQLNEWQEKWLQALESGEYGQEYGRLAGDDGYCCLGVGAVVCGVTEGLYEQTALENYPEVVEKLRLRSEIGNLVIADGEDPSSLTEWNDLDRLSFGKIAARIRANPEKVFTDAV